MTLDPTRPISTARALTMVAAGWLLAQGGLRIFETLFWVQPEIPQPSPITNILLGSFCILLAAQLLFRAPGALLPAILVLLLHAAIQIHLFAILDASAWLSLSQIERLQVIFEGGTSTLVAIGLCVAASLARTSRIPSRIGS
ncbi:MAG: hypothetical protein OSB09_07640 [Planctomycetota bacterium]|nr:hypothetical protein [Planctomycetota bacterium]